MSGTGPVRLYSLLEDRPNTRALLNGELTSPLFEFDFVETKKANRYFKAIVRDLAFDFGELALVTAMQAKVYGKPYSLLPATVIGRYQHHTIFYNADNGPLSAAELNGKRVGVRAYSQTTGIWLRSILAGDYGVDIPGISWVTTEEAHVAEYEDPPYVVRAPEGRTLLDLLMEHDLDAAILGDREEEGPIRYLIPDHESAARDHARRTGGIPINHIAIVRSALVESRPDVVRELYRLLKESRMRTEPPPGGADDSLRFGRRALQPAVERLAEASLAQGLIPRPLSMDELFGDTLAILGDDAA
ncbi:MAG TPA: phosphate ABC transporter substrate-binding protein [Gammaproteobacteria bacterium]